MKFCQDCGHALTLRVPEGDNRERHCCAACDRVHYRNPKNVVGTLPVCQGRIMLCQRAIEPRRGKWTLPAGFMETGESSLEGALRETLEEAGVQVQVRPDSLYTIFNLPSISQVYLFFRAELDKPQFAPGSESLAVALFTEEEIPWQDIAFPVVRSTLECYFRDRPTGRFPVRMFDIRHPPEGHRSFTTTLVSASHSS